MAKNLFEMNESLYHQASRQSGKIQTGSRKLFFRIMQNIY